MPGFPFTTGLAAAGLGGVPGRIGGERLGQQLEVDAAAGAQLSGVPASSSPRRDRCGRELAMRFTRAIVRPPPPLSPPGSPHPASARPTWRSRWSSTRPTAGRWSGWASRSSGSPPDPEFPDSTFVEDAAIVTDRGAILTRPGAPSRAGEVAAIGAALGRWFPELDRITAPGTLDGGDVCEAGDHFFIGVSQRTNAEGAAQLARVARAARLRVERDRHPARCPACCTSRPGSPGWAGDGCSPRREIAGHEALGGWEVVRGAGRRGVRGQLHPGQRRSADRRRVSRRPRRCWASWATTVAAIEMSEYRKMDGGLSCLSVRW